MPLFMIKREYFDLIRIGKKTVELRKKDGPWKYAKVGDEAVFLCGKETERRTITSIREGSLEGIFSKVDFRRILPNTRSRKEAIQLIRRLYPNESNFIAFELEDKKLTDPKLIEFLREVIHSKERRRRRPTRKRIPKEVDYV